MAGWLRCFSLSCRRNHSDYFMQLLQQKQKNKGRYRRFDLFSYCFGTHHDWHSKSWPAKLIGELLLLRQSARRLALCFCAGLIEIWQQTNKLLFARRRRLFVSQRSKLASFDCVCFLTFSTKQKVEFLVILSSFKHANWLRIAIVWENIRKNCQDKHLLYSLNK